MKYQAGNSIDTYIRSPSSRGRGLKYIDYIACSAKLVSPSSRGRGLKSPVHEVFNIPSDVALFTRAWIEMLIVSENLATIIRRPLHEGVD